MSATPPRNSWGIRLAGAAAVALFLWMVGRFWHPVFGFTDLLQFDPATAANEIPALRKLPVYVYPQPGPYDGLYYAQIAYDPLLRNPDLKPAIDNLAYRARRILPSALAWLAAAGRPPWIVHAYSIVNIAAWLALAAVLWRLLPVADGYSAAAWMGVLFSAGALASVRLALTDLIALTILAGAMLAEERKRAGWGLGQLAAAALARETTLLALPAFWGRPWCSRRNALRTAAAAAPLALWLIYVRARAGAGDQGWGNFTWPLAGWVEKWSAAISAARHLSDPLLGWAALLATAGLTAQAIYIAIRPQIGDRWWRLGAAYVALTAFLGTPVWEDFPGAVFRAVLPLTLAFNVLLVRRRAALGWLVLGNLTVFAGLLPFRDAPFDQRELAAVRQGGAACLVREGPGWFGTEHTRRHLWAWSGETSALEFETWPRDSRTLTMEFSLRSLAPRLVVIRQNGRECWRGNVGTDRTAARISVAVAGGRAQLEFSTPTPGVPEAAGPGARTLAFALYDPKVALAHDGSASP